MTAEEIVYSITNEDPEFKVRLAKFSSLDEQYSNRSIIIIPGWLNGIDSVTPLAKEIQKFGNAIIYEPRGFGKSITPHKKGYFNPDEYNKELARVIQELGLKDKEFTIFGSCSGGSQAFYYQLEGNGPKPKELVIISPQEFYSTPFWLPALGLLPTFLLTLAQKMIIVFYRFYMKIRRTGESANVTWAAERLKKNDDWCLRRYVLEFIINYDIRGRQEAIEIPIQMFVAEKDYFVDPEKSKKFLHHPDSESISMKTKMHRVHVGNEEEIAKHLNVFLSKFER